MLASKDDFYIKLDDDKIAYVTVYTTSSDTFIQVKGKGLKESSVPAAYSISINEFLKLNDDDKKEQKLLYFLYNNMPDLTKIEKENQSKISETPRPKQENTTQNMPKEYIDVDGYRVPLGILKYVK
jgi:hypothetical protein